MNQSLTYLFIALLLIVAAWLLPLARRQEQIATCALEDFLKRKFPGIKKIQTQKYSTEMKDAHGITYHYTMIAVFEIIGFQIEQIVEACVEFYKQHGRRIAEKPQAHPRKSDDMVVTYDLRTKLPAGLLVYQIVYNPSSGTLAIHEAAT
ncbi:MAG TPA: hypothetical protein VEC13_01390 [Candidatus Paceibacterota bacterium]|nr:hypothetical protein [Candidatus Paceibacterota bacterium]